MSMPLPPRDLTTKDTKDSLGKLTDDETSHILDAILKSKHRGDSTVLSFIDNFIRCKNIAQAAQETGIAASLGYKIRHRSDVAHAIQKLIDKSAVKHGIDGSEIFERVKEVVDFDPAMLMNRDGTFKSNLHDIAPEARRCLKKLKVKNLYETVEDLQGIKTTIVVGEVIEYDFYDKLKSAELIGKEKQMFKNTTVHEHTVTKDMANILLESRKRAEAIQAPAPVTIEAEVVRDETTNP